MPGSYYSPVFENSADNVWGAFGPLVPNPGAGFPGRTIIEEGTAGDQVAAIRRVATGDKTIRQILLAHSDLERCYTYVLCDPPPFPVRNYTATIPVGPVVRSNQAFVEWWATFDCAAEDYDRWTSHFRDQGFAKWLAAL